MIVFKVSLPVVGRMTAFIEAEDAHEARDAAWSLFETEGEDGFEEVDYTAQAQLGAEVTASDVEVTEATEEELAGIEDVVASDN